MIKVTDCGGCDDDSDSWWSVQSHCSDRIPLYQEQWPATQEKHFCKYCVQNFVLQTLHKGRSKICFQLQVLFHRLFCSLYSCRSSSCEAPSAQPQGTRYLDQCELHLQMNKKSKIKEKKYFKFGSNIYLTLAIHIFGVSMTR